MEPAEPNKKTPEQRREEREDVTREELYALVWAARCCCVAQQYHAFAVGTRRSFSVLCESSVSWPEWKNPFAPLHISR